METEPKTEPRTLGGNSSEAWDWWWLGCACAWVCVDSGTYYIYILRCLFMCVSCVCLQATCMNQWWGSYKCVFLCEFTHACVCVYVIRVVNACMDIHTFNKSVYECVLHSPDPTPPFCFLSFNFPLLVTSGSPMIPPGSSAGPWPLGSLTESCIVQSQSGLGARLV